MWKSYRCLWGILAVKELLRSSLTETVDGAGGDGKNVTKKKDRKPGLDSKAEGGM